MKINSFWWGVIGLVAVVVAALVIALYLDKQQISINKNLCPEDATHVQDYALVLLDGTNPIVGEYRESVQQNVESIARALPHYGKISLYDIVTGKKRLFVVCAPPVVTEYDANRERKKREYESDFLEPLKEAMNKFLSTSRETESSPILQNISKIAALTDFQGTPNRSIYIFSDMLQHESGGSKYSHQRKLGEDEFKKFQQKDFYQNNKPSLNGVSVYVYYLVREKDKHLQTENHRKFWRDLFQDSGASAVTIKLLNLSGEEGGFQSIPDSRALSSPPTPSKNTVVTQDVKPKPAPKLKPKLAPKPKPASKPVPLSPKQQASKYRQAYIQSGGKDFDALYKLLKLHLESRILYRESEEMRDMIDKAARIDNRMLHSLRRLVGEMYLRGKGGFPKEEYHAYVFLKCSGEDSNRIKKLALTLHGFGNNILKSAEREIMSMKGRCRVSKSAPKLKTVPLSPKEQASKYRQAYIQSDGKDFSALEKLLRLHLEGRILYRESDEMLNMIDKEAVQDNKMPNSLRRLVGEMLLYGKGGFPKNEIDAYILLKCSGEYNTQRIKKLESILLGLTTRDGKNVLELAESDIRYMKGEKQCFVP